MYVSTFDKDLLTTDISVAKVLKRISAVGRRAVDAHLVPPKTLTQSAVSSQMERLLQYFAAIGESTKVCLVNRFIIDCMLMFFMPFS